MNKELARVFHDKKLVFSLFIMPAFIMILIYSLMGSAITKLTEDIESHTPILYVENAPEDFVSFLDESGFLADLTLMETGDDTEGVKKEILEGTADLYIVFEEGFLEKVEGYRADGEIPELKTYYNPTEDYSSEAREKFLSQVAEPYRQKLLEERVGDLDSLTVFFIDKEPETSIIVNEDKAGGKALSMMAPYLMVILLFTGPMSLSVDVITGEKERGTMASMLVAPVKRSQIVIGKLLAVSILSCLSALVYTASLAFSMPMMYQGMESIDINVSITPLKVLILLAVVLTLVYLYVAIVSTICVFAKTVKEAGTFVSPAYIIIMVAGVFTIFAGSQTIPLGMFGIPVYGSAVAIQRLLVNELSVPQFGMAVLGNLVAAGLLTFVLTKAFQSERVMFNA
jgi:sodium transport system permease protein